MLKAVPVVAAALVASALIFPTVTQAAETNSVRVSYADLNLASDSGASTLHRRIVHAARVVCVMEDSRDMRLQRATVACRNQAVSDAQPAFDAALAAARKPSVTILDTAIAVIAR